jgi:hypothetical protein
MANLSQRQCAADALLNPGTNEAEFADGLGDKRSRFLKPPVRGG